MPSLLRRLRAVPPLPAAARTRRTGAALLAAAALVAAAALPARAADVSLSCRIAAPGEAGLYQPVPVRFTLKNSGKVPVRVLVWNTPLEEQPSDAFTVRHEGKRAPYTGPMVKRGDPGPDEYVLVKPGVLMEVTVDLAKAYDLTKVGRYTVAFENGFIDAVPDGVAVPRPRGAHEAVKLECPSARFQILD